MLRRLRCLRPSSPRSTIWSSRRGSWSKGCARADTAARFTASAPSFASIGPYRAGDDLKYLDWKLYARSDRLYTRQFRETTNLSVMIALDTSASMAFPETGFQVSVRRRSSRRRSRISSPSRATRSG